MEQENQNQICRHSLSHVLASAVKSLYSNVKIAIGPAIENGFYYDFDMEENIKQEDFAKIEKQMRSILNQNLEFVREEVSKEQAMGIFKDQPYKLQLIEELEKDVVITIYKLGEFVDLCAGPHVTNTSKLQNWAFKIERNSGAYWKGSEKNKMLQRVYVNAFKDKKMLAEYLEKQEQAKMRDHNKLGRELELFTTSAVIGQGLPIMLPRGSKIIQTLQRFVEDEEEKRGYLLTKTPLIAKSDLYKISGHWDHYKESMFVLGDEEKDDEVFALRPMTCPFQFQAYLNKQRSYKELPFRYNETSTLFRNELSGEMHGLIRVRQFTISEGHIICLPDQVSNEFKQCLDLAKFMISTLGFENEVSFRFSKWDKNNKEKYIGDEEQWENAQSHMKHILDGLGLEYTEADGDAAFYGPKLDIQMKNVWGKEDTFITIQLDFALAEKFGMEYIDVDGQKKYPTIIHRTSLGCYERTLALLIEKYAGAFPTWLCPNQVSVLPISEKFNGYAEYVESVLKQNNIRVESDLRNEKIGYKIRQAASMKTPYLIIIGENEENTKTISIRKRGTTDNVAMSIDEFVASIKKEIDSKSIN